MRISLGVQEAVQAPSDGCQAQGLSRGQLEFIPEGQGLLLHLRDRHLRRESASGPFQLEGTMSQNGLQVKNVLRHHGHSPPTFVYQPRRRLSFLTSMVCWNREEAPLRVPSLTPACRKPSTIYLSWTAPFRSGSVWPTWYAVLHGKRRR